MTKDEVLKLALEYVELVPDDRYNAEHIDQDALITAIKAALEAKDEPVAWMFQHEETGRTMCVDAQQLEWGFEKGNPRLKKIAPLYTNPPQRTWTGLTDEDIRPLCKESWAVDTVKQWAVIIEAKLKEKNT